MYLETTTLLTSYIAGAQSVLENAGDIARQKRRGHKHGHGNGEAIGALHALGVLEQQHDEDAADPHDVVDEWNIKLALGVAGVVDAQVRHKVEARCLRNQRERAGNERLRGDDGRHGRKHDGKGAQGLGKHHIERVDDIHREHLGIGIVGEQPSALTQVVEDKGRLNKRPGCIDVCLANVAHVRVEGLGAGRRQKDKAEHHNARVVDGREQEHDAADGVERTQDGQVAEHVEQAGACQEQEPQRHDGAKGVTDLGRTDALNQEEHDDDGERNGDDAALVIAQHGMDRRDGAQVHVLAVPQMLDGRPRQKRRVDIHMEKDFGHGHLLSRL